MTEGKVVQGLGGLLLFFLGNGSGDVPELPESADPNATGVSNRIYRQICDLAR